ncbi:hypothetical protein AB1Y20_001650 [Prymnesium parvum]|uniref:Vacuolar protein sorting-associated protein 52 homolog n=1 Tax=Prymnesium parvum TaxID=97485 RepID=A0AB34K8X3_PRYPA
MAAVSASSKVSAPAVEQETPELLKELDEEDDLDDLFQQDSDVQDALSKGIDLRKYAQEVEVSLREVERDSIQDYIKESEGLAGLHTQIRQCDGVLDSMESMLRGFQTDLASISAQIKYLQDESLSMNVKLRNRKAAESQISGFIQQIVVPPNLISAICEGEVNEAYLEYVTELNKKVAFSKLDSTAMTTACADISPELEKLRQKSVQKIRDFLLQRVGSLKKKMTNVQILQQSVLLKYKGLYKFLMEHAADTAAEIKEAYITTMSAIYQRHVKGYVADLMRLRVDSATKGDLLGHEEWGGSFNPGSLFGNKPATARGDGAYKLGERKAVLATVNEPPLIPAVLQQNGSSLHYEAIFRSVTTLLMDTVGCEHDFVVEFFGGDEIFENIFGKSIFHCMENLEHFLIASWDAIGCLLLLQLNHQQQTIMGSRKVPLLSSFFQRVQVLVWSRFKSIMEAHLQSLVAFTPPKGTPEVHPHFVSRRYAELVASFRVLRPPAVEAMLTSILRALRSEVERLLQERLARLHTTRKQQAAFLINNYELIVSLLAERGARGEDSVHFDQLLDSLKSVFVEEELNVDYGRMITFVKQTEPLVLQGGDRSRVDVKTMEHLLRSFHETWKQGIESIHRDVVKSFPNLTVGMDVLKQVLTQMLLYYTRFLDLVKEAFPSGAPFAQYIISISTLMNEIKNFSRNF